MPKNISEESQNIVIYVPSLKGHNHLVLVYDDMML